MGLLHVVPNIIWLVFGGIWLALAYVLAGLMQRCPPQVDRVTPVRYQPRTGY